MECNGASCDGATVDSFERLVLTPRPIVTNRYLQIELQAPLRPEALGPTLDAQVHNESQTCSRRDAPPTAQRPRGYCARTDRAESEQNCSPRSRRTHLNIGYEIDGKKREFARPVVLKIHPPRRCRSNSARVHRKQPFKSTGDRCSFSACPYSTGGTS
jgi:hypothetical protein